MSTLADLSVKIHADTTSVGPDLQKGLDKHGKTAGQTAAKGIASGIAGALGGALIAAGVVAIIGQSIRKASDLYESQSKVAQIFGESKEAVEKFAEAAARTMGQNSTEALDAASKFGIFGSAAGLTGEKLVGFSLEMTKLASDLASFNNTTPEQAIDAIGSALAGQTRPLRSYGVLLDKVSIAAEAMGTGLIKPAKNLDAISLAHERANIAARKYVEAVKLHGAGSLQAAQADATQRGAIERLTAAIGGHLPILTQQQKVLATGSLIMKLTTTQQGDFARTSGGAANQTRILAAEADNLKEKIGTGLLPVLVRSQRVVLDLTAFYEAHHRVINSILVPVLAFLGTIYALSKATALYNTVLELANTLHLKGLVLWAAEKIAIGWVAVELAALAVWEAVATAATWLLSAAMAVLTSPITLIIALVALFVVGIILLWKHNQTFRTIVLAVWSAIQVAMKAVVQWVTGTLWPSLKKAFTDVGNVLGWLWRNVFVPAWQQIRAVVAVAVDIIQVAMGVLVLIWRNVVMPQLRAVGALFSLIWRGIRTAINAVTSWFTGTIVPSLKKAYTDISNIVIWLYRHTIAPYWALIKAAIKVVGDWFSNTFWPLVKRVHDLVAGRAQALWQTIQRAWNGIRDAVVGVWNRDLKPMFDRLVDVITNRVPGGFKRGVALVQGFWEKLKNAVKVPINFAIGVVNRGIIHTFNAVARMVGVKVGPQGKGEPDIPSFKAGGVVAGHPSPGRDNRVAMVASGEYITPVKQTQKYLPLLRAIHSDKVPGFAGGGIVGNLISGVKSVGNFITGTASSLAGLASNPLGWIKSHIGGDGGLVGRFGSNQLTKTLVAIPLKFVNGMVDWVKAHIGPALGSLGGLFGGGGGAANLGGPSGNSIAAILAMARRFYPGATVSSGYRPGANDYHGQGLAADIIGGGASGMNRIAAGFYAISGKLLELIHSPRYFVKNGQRVGAEFYRSVFAEHFNHVHVAANKNALTGDSGGFLRPGWNMPIFNGTGRNEPFGHGSGGVVIQAGAFPIHVHGNLDASVLPQLQAMINDTMKAVVMQVTKGQRR